MNCTSLYCKFNKDSKIDDIFRRCIDITTLFNYTLTIVHTPFDDMIDTGRQLFYVHRVK